MITLAIELRKSTTNKNGKHPIYLRLCKDRKKKFISLSLSAEKNQWNEEFGLFKKDKRVNPTYIEDNSFLLEQLQKTKNIIDEFERKAINFTYNQFEDAFYGYAKRGNVKDYLEQLIKDMDAIGQIGNANCYKRVLNMLSIYDAKITERVFSEIDYNYVNKFDKFLQKPRATKYTYKSGKERIVQRQGCSSNTRRYYIKGLRAIINKATKDKEASRI